MCVCVRVCVRVCVQQDRQLSIWLKALDGDGSVEGQCGVL